MFLFGRVASLSIQPIEIHVLGSVLRSPFQQRL